MKKYCDKPVLQAHVDHVATRRYSTLMGNAEPERSLFKTIEDIMQLAVSHAHLVHIDVHYAAWMQSLSVSVFDVTTNYRQSHQPRFTRNVQLQSNDAAALLIRVKDVLHHHIAIAKDQMMGAV